MFPLTMTAFALLILLYGAAWHDEPARPTVIERHTQFKELGDGGVNKHRNRRVANAKTKANHGGVGLQDAAEETARGINLRDRNRLKQLPKELAGVEWPPK
jgi:hypothetical protein